MGLRRLWSLQARCRSAAAVLWTSELGRAPSPGPKTAVAGAVAPGKEAGQSGPVSGHWVTTREHRGAWGQTESTWSCQSCIQPHTHHPTAPPAPGADPALALQQRPSAVLTEVRVPGAASGPSVAMQASVLSALVGDESVQVCTCMGEGHLSSLVSPGCHRAMAGFQEGICRGPVSKVTRKWWPVGEKKQREAPGPGSEGRGPGASHRSASCWGLGAQQSWSLVVWPAHRLCLLGPGLTVTLVTSCHSLSSQTVEAAGSLHGECGGGWPSLFTWALCGFCVPFAFLLFWRGVRCPVSPAAGQCCPLLGMCGRASPPPGQRPQRGGVLGTATGSLSGHQKGRAGCPSCFSAQPRSGRCCAGTGLWTSSPRAWGHLVLLSQQALSLGPTCPRRGQPGVCPGAGPWLFLWVLQAHPECSFGSSAHLWCTCRGSDVTPEVPIPGGGLAPGMGVGVRPLCGCPLSPVS